MKTLTCDNPNCQTVFSPPVGEDYAACPACHTWHFVQNSEGKDEAQAPPTIPGTLNYTPTLASAKPIEQEDNSPPSYPLDTPPAMPVHEAHEGNDQIEEVQPLPHLTSADGQRFELKPGINTIGRGECDIRLSDKSVSRLHCVIDVQPRPNGNGWDYIVYDIGHIESSASANGVFLSNRTPRLENYERVPFRKGLILEVGRVKLTLES
jgi:hypothetical protein